MVRQCKTAQPSADENANFRLDIHTTDRHFPSVYLVLRGTKMVEGRRVSLTHAINDDNFFADISTSTYVFSRGIFSQKTWPHRNKSQ